VTENCSYYLKMAQIVPVWLFRQNGHNCAGHNCADWLYWQLNDFGPLESFKPSIILLVQASKWEKAPRKQSERVENPNFDKKKPISEKNIQFHQVPPSLDDKTNSFLWNEKTFKIFEGERSFSAIPIIFRLGLSSKPAYNWTAYKWNTTVVVFTSLTTISN